MSKFINSLEIENVKIDETISDKENVLIIDFTLKNEFNFYIVVNLIDGSTVIRHHFKEDNTCPFCHQKNEIISTALCLELTNYAEKIKTILLNHPSIRLRRLFI